MEKLLEDTAEAQQLQREVDESLASKMTVEEEEEVQEELERLEREANGITEGERPEKVPTMPNAPTTEPIQEEHQQQGTRPVKEKTKEPERQAMLA